MVSVDNAVIASISRKGVEFEILVDPDKALQFRKGQGGSIENILAVNQVFKDWRKGDRASDSDLRSGFETTDVFKIAEFILKEGRLQLTTEQKRKLTEEKRLEVANMIARQGVDPKTHIPHPLTRIQNAMNEARVDIDPFKPATGQVKEILDKIQVILPISFERVTISVKVPVELAGKAGHFIRGTGEMKKEEWRADGWVATITIPAGLQGDIFDKINNLTSGRAEVKVLSREGL